jgi:signal peptidase II
MAKVQLRACKGFRPSIAERQMTLPNNSPLFLTQKPPTRLAQETSDITKSFIVYREKCTVKALYFVSLHLIIASVLKKRYIALLILGVLFLDQWLKIHIKTTYEIGQETLLFGQEWARLRFIENEGMAFGITIDWKYGKLLLTTFRIIMVTGLFYYIHLLLKYKATWGFLVSVALITAGAIGNIIDSVFYGMIFSESPYHGGLAEFTAWGQGYEKLLHGRVVDMFYFPIHNFQMPDFVPIWGGEDFLFFSPIFNIADAAITCGVLSIFLFQRQFFSAEEGSMGVDVPTNAAASAMTTSGGEVEKAEYDVNQVHPDAQIDIETDTSNTPSIDSALGTIIDTSLTPSADASIPNNPIDPSTH